MSYDWHSQEYEVVTAITREEYMRKIEKKPKILPIYEKTGVVAPYGTRKFKEIEWDAPDIPLE